MTQHAYEIIEVLTLSVGALVNLLTLIFVVIYTRSTYSLAQSAHETALEAGATTEITEQSLEISSKMLEEMRETRDAQTAPYVFVYLDQMRGDDATKIFLVVKNAGKGQARDVRVSFDPQLQNDQTYSLEHILQLTQYIPSLPPGGEVRHAFALPVEYLNAEPALPMRYEVRTTYYGGVKNIERVVEQVISLDFFSGSRLNRVEEKYP